MSEFSKGDTVKSKIFTSRGLGTAWVDSVIIKPNYVKSHTNRVSSKVLLIEKNYNITNGTISIFVRWHSSRPF